MKKVIAVIAFALLFVCQVSAQHETLFSRARVVGGFGAPIIEYGLGNDLTTSVGGGGGIVIDNFFLGGYGLGSVDFDRLFEEGDIDNLEIGHGGFWLGYTFNPYRVIHLYTNARIGWGVLDVNFNDNNVRYSDLDKIFVVTPELGIELNLTRWFRIAGSAGFRWVNGIDEDNGYKEDDFNGAVATVAFRFGWFGNRYGSRRNDGW